MIVNRIFGFCLKILCCLICLIPSVHAAKNYVVFSHTDIIDQAGYSGTYSAIEKYLARVALNRTETKYLLDLYFTDEENPFRLSFVSADERNGVTKHLKLGGSLDVCRCLMPDLETIIRYNQNQTRWRKAKIVGVRNICDYGQLNRYPQHPYDDRDKSLPPETIKSVRLLPAAFDPTSDPEGFQLAKLTKILEVWPFKGRVVFGATGPQIVQHESTIYLPFGAHTSGTSVHVDSANSVWRKAVEIHGTATDNSKLKCPGR